ncbi:MAG: pyrroline-5-carboxylate reductase [Robiginitomaculum sp.]|nr:MAG: pyrroline-5-carboxylate reductase [Robiginitomaculum sp.]
MRSVVKHGKLSSNTHALIGAGNMGGALLNGWLSEQGKGALQAHEILVIDPSPGQAAKRALQLGVKFSARLTKGSASGLKMCLLAIKPQSFGEIGPRLAAALPKDTLVVSIMAGINLHTLSQIFTDRPIVRAMPNLPAAYGAGITAYVGNECVTPEHLASAELRLKAGGKVVRLESEREIDMVTAVSGSGPGYVFYMTEALAAAGEKLGLSSQLASELARQTVIGSGVVLSRSSDSAEALRKSVTSPAGTTEAALDVIMDKDGLAKIMRAAVKAAYNRSRDLGKS